jgi:hypothetical protein
MVATLAMVAAASPAAIVISDTTTDLVTQAEDYDASDGGLEVKDQAGNSTGQFVGNFRNGDYVQFALDVQTAGTYTVDIRYAHDSSGRSIALLEGNDTDGFTQVKDWALGNSNGWTTFQYTDAPAEVTLEAGTTNLRFQSTSTGANLDEWTISYVPEPATMSLLGLGGLVALRRRRRA